MTPFSTNKLDLFSPPARLCDYIENKQDLPMRGKERRMKPEKECTVLTETPNLGLVL